MYKYICTFLLLLSCHALSAQTPVWANNIGANTNNGGKSCKVAPNGNVVMGGKFTGTMDLDPGPGVYNITSLGNADIFLACYTSAGTFLWGFGIGGSGYDAIEALNIDANSNVVICGYIQSAGIDFDPGVGVAVLPYAGGTGLTYFGDGFVAKYSATGAYQWAKDLGGSTVYDHAGCVNTDVNGNVYVGGEFDNTMTVSSSITLNSATTGQGYLIKYNAAGTVIWAHNFGEPATVSTDCCVYGLQISNGYVYTCGLFQGAANFDPWGTAAYLTAVGTIDAYISKYDTNGNYIFAYPVSGSGNLDQLMYLTLDGSDNMYVTGLSTSTNMTFNPASPGTSTVTAPGGGGNYDIILAKYNSNGAYQWGTLLGSTGNDYGWSVDIANGYLYNTGYFHNTVDMDPSSAVSNLVSSGGEDAYVNKYDLNGGYICGFRLGSATTDDACYAVTHDPITGSIYISGQFGGGTVDFDPGSASYPLTSISSLDAFLAKYNYTSATTISGTLKGDTICSGAAHLTVTITSATIGPYTVTYTDGTNSYTQTGVTSGVPFTTSVPPVVTTTYTITAITNAATGICYTATLSGFAPAVVVVNNCCDILSMPDSVHVCPGDTLTMKDTLTGGNSILSVLWTPATGLSSTTVLNPLLTATTSGWYDLTVQSLIPTNLVVNGDFSGGNTGFTSTYTYVTGPGSLFPASTYAITTDPILVHSAAVSFGDHTTGTGNMMAINGASTPTSVWCQTIPVTPNTDYNFSAWVANWSTADVGSAAPELQFQINGILIGAPDNITAAPAIWVNFSSTWNSGTNTSATICIYDEVTAATGNDFALDDISFQQICKVKDSTYVDVGTSTSTTRGKDTTVCANVATVTLNAPAGYNPYLWSTSSTSSSINVTTAGTYWVQATNHCDLLIDTFHLRFKPLPVVNLGRDTTICNGDSLILSSVQPAGSIYQWSTGSTADSIHVVTGGTYWLQVDSGCVFRDSIVVTFSPSPGVNLGPDTTDCSGQPVVLQSLVSYGSGVSYVWSTGATTPAITAVSSGVYWLQVSNTGCPGAVDSIHVNIFYDTVKLNTPDTAVCKGVSVQVLVTGAPSNTYQWVPTTGIAASNVSSPVIIADTSAEYVLTASFPGCPDIKDSLYLDVQPNPINVYIGGNRSLCAFDTVHIHASVTPAWYTHYSYSWSPSGSLDNATLSSVVFTAGDSTEVVVNVTTPAGCKGVDSAFMIVYPPLTVFVDSVFNLCPHDSVQFKPTGAVSYSWSPSIYLDDAGSSSPWVHPITSQYYTLIATSQYGCKDTLGVNVTVHPAAVIYLGDPVTLYPGDFYQVSPQTNCTYFVWSPTSGLNNAYVSNPVAIPQVNTTYIVHGTTEWGCTTTDSLSIYVSDESLIDIPNAFSPGNGPNSLFKIIRRGIVSLNYFRIYNRWGNLVYESTNIDAGWDGTYKGKAQPFDVYVYEVSAATGSGKTINKHGNVTLLR